MKKLTVLSALAGSLSLFTLSIPAARADDDSSTRPNFTVGVGGRYAEEGFSLLLNVGFEVRHAEGKIKPGFHSSPIVEQVIAHFSASAAIQPDAQGWDKLPYLEVTFEAYHPKTEISDSSEVKPSTLKFAEMAIIAGKVRRFTAIDQDWSVTVSLAKIQLGVIANNPELAQFYAQAAVDLFGPKIAAHVRDLTTFAGFHIAGVEGEAGLMLKTKPVTVRFAVGANADINWWTDHAMSEMGVYAAIRATITRYVEVWARGGLDGWWDSRNDAFFKASPQIMVGVTGSY